MQEESVQQLSYYLHVLARCLVQDNEYESFIILGGQRCAEVHN